MTVRSASFIILIKTATYLPQDLILSTNYLICVIQK